MIYYLDPFGCAKNQVDAELMMARLNAAGWTGTADPDGADLIIVNSCAFVEEAKRESINAVLAWKKQYPDKKVLLAGCLAQRYRAELEESLPEADAFTGCEPERAVDVAAGLFEKTPSPSPAMDGGVSNALAGVLPVAKLQAEKPQDAVFQPSAPLRLGVMSSRDNLTFAGQRPLLGFPGSAYVKIAEGCDNNCSFCAIPLIRGPLRCRSIPDIVEECKHLLERGVRELCLIGQDIAAYKTGLSALLEAIAALPGAFWVRLLYLHPDHFPLDILPILEADSRFLPYFDIPLQHASPRLLSLMGRRGSGESYLRLLDTIRSRLPDAVIRSTFLVGFPGETEEDFKQLLDFQRQACFDWLGVFAYSREEGTPAYSMKNRVAKNIALRRKALVEEAQISITEDRMNRFVGRALDVLVEEALAPSEPSSGALQGESLGEALKAPEEPSPGAFPDLAENTLWLGRLFCHAPEVDGAAVIQCSGPTPQPVPGQLVRGTVFARAGFDLEVRIS